MSHRKSCVSRFRLDTETNAESLMLSPRHCDHTPNKSMQTPSKNKKDLRRHSTPQRGEIDQSFVSELNETHEEAAEEFEFAIAQLGNSDQSLISIPSGIPPPNISFLATPTKSRFLGVAAQYSTPKKRACGCCSAKHTAGGECEPSLFSPTHSSMNKMVTPKRSTTRKSSVMASPETIAEGAPMSSKRAKKQLDFTGPSQARASMGGEVSISLLNDKMVEEQQLRAILTTDAIEENEEIGEHSCDAAEMRVHDHHHRSCSEPVTRTTLPDVGILSPITNTLNTSIATPSEVRKVRKVLTAQEQLQGVRDEIARLKEEKAQMERIIVQQKEELSSQHAVQVNEKQEEIKQLHAQNKSLQDSTMAQSSHIKSLESQIAALQSDLSYLQSQLSSQLSSAEQSKEEREQLYVELRHTKETLKEQQERLAGKERELEARKEEYEAGSIKAAEEQTQAIMNMQQTVSSVTARSAELEAELVEKSAALSSLQAKFDALEKNNAVVEQQVAAKSTTISSLQHSLESQLAAANDVLVTLQASNAKMQEEKAKLIAEAASQQQQSSLREQKLQFEATALKQKLRSYETSLAAAQEQSVAIADQCQSLKDMMAAESKETEEVKAKLQETEQLLETARQDMRVALGEKDQKDAKIVNMQHEQATLVEMKDSLQATIQRLQQELQTATQEKSTIALELATVKQNLISLDQAAQQQLEESESRSALIKKHLDSMTQHLAETAEETRLSLEDAREKKASLLAQIEQQKIELNQAAREKQALEKKNAVLQQSLNAFIVRAKELKAGLSLTTESQLQMDATLALARAEIESLRTQLQATESDAKAQEEELNQQVAQKVDIMQQLQAQVTSLTHQLELVESKNSALIQQCSDLAHSNDEKDLAISSLTDAHAREVEQIQSSLTEARSSLEDLIQRYSVLQHAFASLEAAERALREAEASKDAISQQAVASVEDKIRRLAMIQEELIGTKNELRAVRASEDSLLAALESSRRLEQEQNRLLDILYQQNDSLSQDHRRTLNQLMTLKKVHQRVLSSSSRTTTSKSAMPYRWMKLLHYNTLRKM